MKAKFILVIILCLCIGHTAEAQLLKKIKKQAEQAAERTILRKTDEVVSGTTEKTIDDVANGNKNNTENKNSESINDTLTETRQANTAYNPMPSKNTDASKLPANYVFDWEFKTEMTSLDGDKVQMNYLLQSKNKYYTGMEMITEKSKQQGTVLMVMDSKADAITMFMSSNGQNMAQMSKLPDPGKKSSDEEFTYKEIGTKTILGYECFGIEVENKGYKATMYYTLDAPVSFSALFNFSKNSAHKVFDPALIEVLKDEALLMEMDAVDKKKSKESYTLTAVSLNKKDTSIKKSDYQFMNMGF